MKLAKKSSKRVDFLKKVMKLMKTHELFADNVARQNDTESAIQKMLFQRMDMGKGLSPIIQDVYHKSEQSADKLVKHNFCWEQDRNTTVNHFTLFGKRHRPDAVLKIDGLKVAIEIKKGDSGGALRMGLGQSLLYANNYDFTLYLFVDHSEDMSIRDSVNGKKEKSIIDTMWSNRNVMFEVI